MLTSFPRCQAVAAVSPSDANSVPQFLSKVPTLTSTGSRLLQASTSTTLMSSLSYSCYQKDKRAKPRNLPTKWSFFCPKLTCLSALVCQLLVAFCHVLHLYLSLFVSTAVTYVLHQHRQCTYWGAFPWALLPCKSNKYDTSLIKQQFVVTDRYTVYSRQKT